MCTTSRISKPLLTWFIRTSPIYNILSSLLNGAEELNFKRKKNSSLLDYMQYILSDNSIKNLSELFPFHFHCNERKEKCFHLFTVFIPISLGFQFICRCRSYLVLRLIIHLILVTSSRIFFSNSYDTCAENKSYRSLLKMYPL